MQALATAVLPVFLLILLGHLIRRRGWIAEGFWEPAERLTYFFLLPALLVTTLAGADFAALPAAAVAGATLAAIVTISLVILLFHFATRQQDGPALTALIQTAIRPNSYIGLAVPFALYGQAGLAVAALLVAVVVPTVNLISVAALARFGGAHLGHSPRLARAALPLALLAVGAGLDLAAARASGSRVAAAAALKLAGLPLLTAGFCLLFGVTGLAWQVALIFAALPAATSSYILARQMGGAPALVANILSVQTLTAAFTLSLLILLIT